ncbi:subtilisin-like protein [Thozetella sp. PMI_491]|nr:subtilisin-like protein [Thozetella sp. PMI_491]
MEQLFIWPGRDTALHDQDPYLNCPLFIQELQSATDAQDETDGDTLSRHPLLLTFGLRLLEIESGQQFIPDEVEDADFETNAVLPYLTLQRVLRTLQGEGSVEDGYLKVAQACLDFDDQLNKLHGIDADEDTKYRIAIYRFIFLPLLEELRSRFAEAAADFLETETSEVLPKVSPPSLSGRTFKRRIGPEAQVPMPAVYLTQERWQKHIPHATSPLSVVVTAHTEEIVTNYNDKVVISQGESRLFGNPKQPRKRSGHLALFDEKHEASDAASREVSYAEDFFDQFKEFRSIFMKPLGTRSRVKIAVLDTGVDEQDLEFQTRRECITEDRLEERPECNDDPVKATKSFVDSSTEDTNGHGTHVAGLLLRVAPDADIYIAKIADQLSFDTISHIPQAIRWAKEMGCDIITMSFGMVESSQTRDDLTAIEDAIKEADAAGMLMFAAASNCGGNGSRTYPASDRHVICVHALDGHGYLAGGINPPVEHFSQDNFGTLGVAIPCSWRKKIVYKSGTSFATPIAAGIAANILDYMDYSLKLGKLDGKKYQTLRQGYGMKQLFSKFMSTELAGCGYRFVAPWLLWKLDQEEVDDEYIWSKLKVEYKLHG